MRRWLVFLAGMIFCGFFSLAEAAPLPPPAVSLQQVNCDALAAAATEFLEEMIASGQDSRRHSVELVRKPRDFMAPEGEVTFEPAAPFGVRYGSTTAVEVMVKIDGKGFRKVRCSYKVHVFDQVVVATKNLQPRQIIARDDVCLEERDVSSVNRKYVGDLTKIIGREANRIIKSGALFTTTMIVNPVIIESGASINIMAVVNGIVVKTEGIALDRGRLDGIIRVKNADSGKVLRGKVIDGKTVQVL